MSDQSVCYHLRQGQPKPSGKWGFEVRLSRVYTKAVFAKFEDTLKDATAYKAVEDRDRCPNGWQVQHQNHSD